MMRIKTLRLRRKNKKRDLMKKAKKVKKKKKIPMKNHRTLK
jgi:hypothetical protein